MHGGSRDITFLVGYVILQDHFIIELGDFIDRDLSSLSYHLVEFGGHRHSSIGEKIFLVCEVISKNHVIKEPCDLMGTIFPSFVTVAILVVEI